LFGGIKGVSRTRVGYSGGKKPRPSYRDMGDHTETTQVDFDPSVVSFDELLKVFWAHHSPTRTRGGLQYRCVVFCHNNEQRVAALRSRDELQKTLTSKITTDIDSFDTFTLAEDYHQKFYLRNKQNFFTFFEKMNLGDFINSPSAAILNAYVEGHATSEAVIKAAKSWTDLKRDDIDHILALVSNGKVRVSDSSFACART